MNTGDDSIVIGNVGDNENIGNRTIRVGSTDQFGNVILRPDSGGIAIGNGAKAGSYGIAIGTNAAAGPDIFSLLNELSYIAKEGNDDSNVKNISNLILELQKDKPEKAKVNSLWEMIEGLANVDGALDLILKVSPLIISFLK
jgi:hypothetical protein